LISSYPTAVDLAGSHFNLRKSVEKILSKKRSIAMGTKLHLKVIGSSISLVLVFGIAGIHARSSAAKNDDAGLYFLRGNLHMDKRHMERQ